MSKKYIGVDLAGWYGDKTRIAIGEKKEDKLVINRIYGEFGENGENGVNSHIKGKKSFNKTLTFEEKNDNLAKFLIQKAGGNALIAIDAPFAIPSVLNGNREEDYDNIFNNEKDNPYIYDNTDRIIYDKSDKKVNPLAPAGDKLGRVTARMVHLIKHYGKELHILKEASYDKSQELATIEVYPKATLYKINEKFEILKEIPSYKSKKDWKANKDKMWQLIEQWVEIDESLKKRMENDNYEENDDDYDAVVCALSAFFVDEFGYVDDKKELCSNRFIYIPTNIQIPENIQ